MALLQRVIFGHCNAEFRKKRSNFSSLNRLSIKIYARDRKKIGERLFFYGSNADTRQTQIWNTRHRNDASLTVHFLICIEEVRLLMKKKKMLLTNHRFLLALFPLMILKRQPQKYASRWKRILSYWDIDWQRRQCEQVWSNFCACASITRHKYRDNN